MLETGKRCISCDRKFYLKDFKQNSSVCNNCSKEAEQQDFRKQLSFKMRYNQGDAKVSSCNCGRYYLNERKKKNGEIVYFKECNRCRSTKLGTKIKTESIGMMAPGDRLSQLREEKREERKETKNNMPQTKSSEKKNQRGARGIMKKTKSERLKERPSGENQTEKNITPTAGRDTRKLSIYPQSSNAGESMIPQSDSSQILIKLKEENSGSIQQLSDSSEQLIGYAKRLAKPLRVADDDNEILQDTSVERIMNAAKCLDMARNTMKAKLDYLKFSKSLMGHHSK